MDIKYVIKNFYSLYRVYKRVDFTIYMSGFRPVISLKEGTSVLTGDRTPTDPYVVES